MTEAQQPAGWAALFGPTYRTAMSVLAGGVLLFAMNVYLTTSLLPSAVAQIGGRSMYAWAMTAFLVAAVMMSLFVGRLLGSLGPRSAYLVGFGLFGLGSLIAALAPTMPVLLVGRAVQGLGGGLLAGLAFAVIRQTLPEHLWTRGLGVVSAMWGVGNLVGPSVGGLFAQFHQWRWALGVLVLLSAALAAMAARSMAARTRNTEPQPVPVLTLATVVAAAALVSVAGVLHGWVSAVLLVGGLALLVAFVRRERRQTVRILPGITYRRRNPLKWVYASIALLTIGSTVETFIPLFGQQLGALGPLAAGLLGAALSFGWSTGSIGASTVDNPHHRALLRMIGPGLLALGLAAYGALQRDAAPTLTVLGWAVTLYLAGVGIGVAFQHGVTAAMAAATDPDEATRAATGVNTVQLMSNALGSALAGVLVNLGSSTVSSAHDLLFTFAAVTVIGVLTAVRANRPSEASPEAQQANEADMVGSRA